MSFAMCTLQQMEEDGMCREYNPHEGVEKSKQTTYYLIINNVLRLIQIWSMNIHVFCDDTCWLLGK
jgi:hypothetical protein